MKRSIIIFISIFLLLLSGCSEKDKSNGFNYLPILEGSTLISSEEAVDDNPAKFEYSLGKVDMLESASSYKKLFEEKGWKIDEENSPSDTVFKYVKDDHWAVILFAEGMDDITYSIITK